MVDDDVPPSPVRARYRILLEPGESARERGEAIAREQSLEVPPGASTPEIDARFLGRVEAVRSLDLPGGRVARVEVAYPAPLFDGSLTQLLNVLWGNVSLMDGVLLEDADLPPAMLEGFPGPALGVPGLRERVAPGSVRPLVSSALKPVGLDVPALVRLARTLARAGVDVIKDDHGLADQPVAPFSDRVLRVSEAVQEENARTGGRTLYFPNVTAGARRVEARAREARDAGCDGVVICPGLTGLDGIRLIREEVPGLAVMAHPSHAATSPGAVRGIAPDFLMGTLWRLAGADCVVYVNARGRFAWPVETCKAINRRARAPLGAHLPAFPVPAGGIQAGEVAGWFETYGPDTLLLIGGSVLEAPDVEARARAVVEAAHRAGPPAGSGGGK
jgi:ribulose-bisphosphate carboxylase large chain